jgi:hypothetical protein
MGTKPWVLGQQTKHGFQYFTGKGYPWQVDAWTPDIRKAQRLSVVAIDNMREWVSTYTSGAPVDKVNASNAGFIF